MGSLPPAMGLAPAPATSTPRPPSNGEGLVMWIYLDEGRTHEVVAGMRKGAALEFFVRERAVGLEDPASTYEATYRLQDTWESQLHHLALETRLGLLGTYHRQNRGVPGWRPVRRPAPGKSLHLTPLDLDANLPTHVHYYGSRTEARSVLLLATPHDDPVAGRRYHVARLEFAFPDAEGGELRRLHPHLPAPVARSVLAAEHLDLADRGLEKVLAVDRSLPANADWCDRLRACVLVALQRVREGRLGGVRPPPPSLASAGTAPRRPRGYQIEDAEPVRESGQAPPPPKIEESTTDYLTALTSPRILALHQRFLTPAEEQEAFAAGELGLRQLIQRKRAQHDPQTQHLLSILEASLLVRYALSPRGNRKIDPVMGDLLRRALVYV